MILAISGQLLYLHYGGFLAEEFGFLQLANGCNLNGALICAWPHSENSFKDTLCPVPAKSIMCVQDR